LFDDNVYWLNIFYILYNKTVGFSEHSVVTVVYRQSNLCLSFLCLQHKCYIVATCDKDLKRRIRKIPGVPIMYMSQHRLAFGIVVVSSVN